MGQTTSEIFASQGIPYSVWGPIMQTESKGDPGAYLKTQVEESVGLFQLNRMGGLGVGYSVENLKKPEVNAGIAAEAMAQAYTKGVAQGLTGFGLTQYVAYNSGWPTQAGTKALEYDPVVQAYNPKLQEAYTGLTGVGDNTGQAVGISSQLQSLQGTAQAHGGGWAAEAQGIGVMVLLAGLGLILLFLGLKLIAGSGGASTIIKEEAVGE